jgi:hypothetical protein
MVAGSGVAHAGFGLRYCVGSLGEVAWSNLFLTAAHDG